MAQWTVRHYQSDEADVYEVVTDAGPLARVEVREDADVSGWRAAALMLRARVIGRLEDPKPIFGFSPDNPQARPFVEMLNEAA